MAVVIRLECQVAKPGRCCLSDDFRIASRLGVVKREFVNLGGYGDYAALARGCIPT